MNSREQTLAFILLGLIVFTIAGAGGYFFILQPLQRHGNEEITLNQEITDLEKQVEAQKITQQRLAQARVRSLPADIALARREYVVALERLIESAGVPKGYTITPKALDNSSRAVPELSKGKPIYTRVGYELVFKKTDMWAVKDFLYGYYQLGLLHQITSIHIKRDDDPGAKNAGRRNDLTVTLTTEAILVDGAENRKTLFPVPTAFAAVGGGAMYKSLTLTPEAARGIQPELLIRTLSPVGRDYSLMVQKDPFHGPLPPPKKESPPSKTPFELARFSDVKVKTDVKPDPVRVAIRGDGANGATFAALASGELYAEGALKVDPKNFTIELPTTSATGGSATITVIATSADGKKTDKKSFKVTLAEPEKKIDNRDEISAFVILIGATPRSDGTAWARIKDNANRLRYEIEAHPKGVVVVKEWSPAADRWRKDLDYEHPPGVLQISDDSTKTNRTFRVIAVDADGLIVADLKPEGSATAPPPKLGKGGFGGPRPPGKGGFNWPPKQGHADPLAVLGGNRIAAQPKPKLYRWEVGQSLANIEEIPDDEAKKILKQAETSGPVFDAISAGP